MIVITAFQSFTDHHVQPIAVGEFEAYRLEAECKRQGVPVWITDQETGIRYELAWVDCGSSYRGHVILRRFAPAVRA
jgi:hypothetical protein